MPTVAALTPVVRGSFRLSISSPLRKGKRPLTAPDISWMPGGTSSETGVATPTKAGAQGNEPFGGGPQRNAAYIRAHGPKARQQAPRGHHRDRMGKCDRRRGQVDSRGDERARARARRGRPAHGGETAHHL